MLSVPTSVQASSFDFAQDEAERIAVEDQTPPVLFILSEVEG
jgi:hypothetical protein